jgi:hypothetical protein
MYADIVEGGIIKNIIISNYGYGRKGINKIDPKTSLIFMKNFSYPLHTYGMKDDYLEYLQYDVNVFAQTYNEEADMMKKLVDNSDNYICNLEDNDPRDLEIFVKQLVK